MVFRIGLILVVVGAILGWVGDIPIGHPAYTSIELMVAGGLTLAVGLVLVLWTSGQNTSRGDEPPGYIRP